MVNSVSPVQNASDIDIQARNLAYSPDTLSYQFYSEVLMVLFKIRGPGDYKLRRFNCCQAFS